MALGSNTLIDLEYMHVFPRNVFFGKGTKHHPGRVAPADSHDETAARGDGVTRLRGDHRGRFLSDCVRVRKHFNSHWSSPYRASILLLAAPYRACIRCAHSSQAAGEYGTSAVVSVADGLCQPPAGLRRSASAGPQVCGSYS